MSRGNAISKRLADIEEEVEVKDDLEDDLEQLTGSRHWAFGHIVT
jgi:hypothetical protein